MENPSDSDTSSESEYNSGEGFAAVSDCDEDEPSQDLEPEPSEYYNEYMNTAWNPDTQIKAQLDATQLAQLHAEIKAWAEIPADSIYSKLLRFWPFRLFDICILPDYIQYLIYYFELFWSLEV